MVRLIITSIFLTFLFDPTVIATTHNGFYIGYNCTGSANSSVDSNKASPLYLYNLYNLLGTFTSHASSAAYYNSSLGQTPNCVYAFYICRFDQSAQSCSACINEAKDRILKACPYQTEAIIWYENCMMRYSRYSFFGKMDVSPWVPIMEHNKNISKSQVENFAVSMRKSMNDLAGLTANSSTPRGKFQMRVVNLTGFGKLYETAQCVPEITAKDCHLCLKTAVERVAISVSARALLPSCIVWYQTTPFYNSSAITYPFFNSSSPPHQPTTYSGRKKRSTHIIVAACVPIIVAILLFSGAWFCIYRRRRTKPSSDMEDIVGLESLQFEFRVIKAATDNFSPKNKLGQGGFGVVYKGKLQDEQEIAVKRLSIYSGQGISEFKTEILLAAKLQHNNLAKLLGFSLHGEEKLLIYELLPNASLDKVLFGQNKVSLDWETRYKIILGTARGLLYLHEDSRLKIIHRDLKSSNILLDETMNPKITDFGLARLVGRDQIHVDTSKIAGTYGYMAPEYALTGRFSVKSDVYSFGIIALELISGHMCSSVAFPYHEESLTLRAWKLWKGNATLDLVDPRLDGNFQGDEMARCIHISLLCIQEDSNKRPTMATIVSVLNGHQVALSEPDPPLLGPSTNITFGFHQNLGLSSSSEFLSNNDNITELHPR